MLGCELIAVESDSLYLDVRETSELPRIQKDRLLQIPLDDLGNRHGEIPTDEKIVVCCQSGKRSMRAIEYLRDNFGFENLSNLEGGVNNLMNE